MFGRIIVTDGVDRYSGREFQVVFQSLGRICIVYVSFLLSVEIDGAQMMGSCCNFQ